MSEQETTMEAQKTQAFQVDEINIKTGRTFISIQRGIHGTLANQLKNTSNRRKGSSILRKLGHMLADCGDVHYGTKSIEDTSLDPNIVTDEDEES